MGAWIETISKARGDKSDKSHPIWVRGLKQRVLLHKDKSLRSRTPYGCVD